MIDVSFKIGSVFYKNRVVWVDGGVEINELYFLNKEVECNDIIVVNFVE